MQGKWGGELEAELWLVEELGWKMREAVTKARYRVVVDL